MALFFVVALQSSTQAVENAITSKIPATDLYKLEAGKWMIDSGLSTSKEVSDSLGLTANASHFIVPVRGYFGRAQPDLWEWLAAKTSKTHA
jgi:hypothetical protein